MNISLTVLSAALICCLFMTVLWFVQKQKKEADIVDFGWTICLGFLGTYYSIFAAKNVTASVLVAVFSCLWCVRLATHLWRRVQSVGEDGRYVALRSSWGEDAQRNFFVFFQAQALLAVFLSSCFLVAILEPSELKNWQIVLACCWFVFSLGFEALSDKQLEKWRDNPNNAAKTCRLGLWNYSRHPNYFFEWLYWFSYSFLAINSDYWYIALISPMLLLYSILKITGIPPTEARAILSKGEDYKRYQQSTSAFIPWLKMK